MNCYCEKECWASVPILCRITLQNTPYMDYNLLVLTSLEVTKYYCDYYYYGFSRALPAVIIATCWFLTK